MAEIRKKYLRRFSEQSCRDAAVGAKVRCRAPPVASPLLPLSGELQFSIIVPPVVSQANKFACLRRRSTVFLEWPFKVTPVYQTPSLPKFAAKSISRRPRPYFRSLSPFGSVFGVYVSAYARFRMINDQPLY
ncbi:hypothetical protein GYMLUDRAFT_753405 [Collybiopsis luxurians FD-317 M1]|uniref:Uncharacterized protein n=1 Tax=Collybiopsis luxurians FD-317 M1 TaxID=944289 RepID=A0A0D0B314_9AGAR|nr:hypothetical protein GYMLUDRAFT_753405 [Collybiopsis luxurians FD-317 M1]